MKISFILLISLLLIGCNQSNNQDASSSMELATNGNSSITADDFNEYLLSLPVQQRWPLKNTKEWLESSLKRLSINKQLITESKLIGLDQQPEYKQKIHNIKRILFTNQYIQSQSKTFNVSDESLKKYYEENIDIFDLPEKRTVRHIYKAFNDDKELAQSQINDLQQRLKNGENFKIIASEYSDSETRHNDGFIGIVKMGDLSKDFDEIIFGLKKDKPSDLVFTKDGIHIFVVDNILESKSFTLDSVKSMILHQINMNESIKVIQELSENLEVTEDFKIPSKEEMEQIYLSGNEQSPLLKIGSYSLTIDNFNTIFNEVKTNLGIIQIKDLQYIVLQDIAYREIIFQYMLENNIELIDKTALKSKSEQILIELMGNYKMKAYLNEHPELVNEYFVQNSMRFSTPVMVNLEILRIPIKEGINLMEKLEEYSQMLNQGSIDFEEIKNNYNGKIIKLGMQNAFQLAQISSKLLHFAFKVKKGNYSNPFTADNHYNILKVTNIIEAKEQPLINVRDKVIDEYINSNSALIYSKVSEDITKNLNINNQAVDQYIKKNKRL